MSVISVEQRIMERVAWGQVALGSERRINMNDQGHALVAQGLPPLVELARNGKIFTKIVGNGATFKAPLVAVPAIATAATWFLFNDSSTSTGTCLIPIRVSAFLASGTSDIGTGLALQVPKGEQTRFTADYSGVTTSNSVGTNGTGNAYLGNAKTMIGAQAAWDVHFLEGHAASAVFAGSGITVNLQGDKIVKPQHGMAIEVFAGAGTTALFGVSVTYAEVELDCV